MKLQRVKTFFWVHFQRFLSNFQYFIHMQTSKKENESLQGPPVPPEASSSHFQMNSQNQTREPQEGLGNQNYQLQTQDRLEPQEQLLDYHLMQETQKAPAVEEIVGSPNLEENIKPAEEMAVRQKSQSIHYIPKTQEKQQIKTPHKSSGDNFEMFFQTVEDDLSELPLHSLASFIQQAHLLDVCSSGSDTSEPKTGNSKQCQHDVQSAQSFQSQSIPEVDTVMSKCLQCQRLRRNNKKYEAENSSFAAQLNELRRQNTQLRQSKRQCQMSTQFPEVDEFDFFQLHIEDRKIVTFLRKLEESIKAIKEPGFQQILRFTTDQQNMIARMIKHLKFLLRSLDKEQLIDRSEKIEKTLVHKYTKIIEVLTQSYEQKILKLNANFGLFMEQLKKKDKKKEEEQCNKEKQNCEKRRVQKKTNSLHVATEDFYTNPQIEYLKEKVSLLELNLREEKKKNNNIQTINKALIQKYSKEVAELRKQNNFLFNTVKQYEKNFDDFMLKIALNPSLTSQLNHKFFNTVSLRIFEISNCIPFQENDDQSLFAPDNEGELMDMIERIRRFSLTIEDYTSKKDSYEVNMKKSVTTLFKDLVDAEKVSLKYAIKLIKNNNDLELDYLKDFLMHLLEKKSKKDTTKLQSFESSEKKKRKSLSLEKIGNLLLHRFDSPMKKL